MDWIKDRFMERTSWDGALLIAVGVIVLIGLIEVFIFPLGPFILKLIPNKPSPISFGITMSPKIGILDIILLRVFAGTKVPLKLVKPSLLW